MNTAGDVRQIRSVGVLSVAKVLGIVYAVIGLIVGIFFAIFAAGLGQMELPGAGGGIAAVIILPIMYGLIGFIGGAITAFVYNVVASAIGGIEIVLW